MSDDRKGRSTNFSPGERELLVELAIRYQQIIENKRTDAVTTAEKDAAWIQLVADYNSVSLTKRSVKQLKQVGSAKYRAGLKFILGSVWF